jgi:hypothetical protein
MSPRTTKAILKKIEAEKAKVSASRDRIRELIDQLEEYEGAWTDAAENLGYAADRLSELL